MAALGQPAVILLLTLCCIVSTCQARNANGSCMVHWMLQAGISVTKATQYETTFLSLGLGESEIGQYNQLLLGFVMGRNIVHAIALKKCLHGSQRGCADYDPCRVNGTCVLSEDQSHYKCNCAMGYKGKFCDHRIDECASNPCQHGGVCADHVNHFTCTCAAGFDGTLCETKWLKASSYRPLPNQVEVLTARVAAVESKNAKLVEANSKLEENVSNMAAVEEKIFKLVETNSKLSAEVAKIASMDEKISKLEAARSHQLMNVMGYAYSARHNARNNANTGHIATMPFTKKQGTSLLRLSYSANIRTLGGLTAARWYFKIDGNECSSPEMIDVAMFQNAGDNTHIPSYLMGICNGTASGAIGAGQHKISVHVGAVPGYILANAFSGWESISFLEVQELSPPF